MLKTFLDWKNLAQRHFALPHHLMSSIWMSKVDNLSIFIICQKVVHYLLLLSMICFPKCKDKKLEHSWKKKNVVIKLLWLYVRINDDHHRWLFAQIYVSAWLLGLHPVVCYNLIIYLSDRIRNGITWDIRVAPASETIIKVIFMAFFFPGSSEDAHLLDLAFLYAH